MRSPRLSGLQTLPLAPLLHAYCVSKPPDLAALHGVPRLGPRLAAVFAANSRFLNTNFLDRASDETWRDALVRFYQTVTPGLHTETVRRRAGFLRHTLSSLLLGRDSAAAKLEACLAPKGTYRVPGLGPSFWSAVVQSMAPARYPGWTSLTQQGLNRCGLGVEAGAGPARCYSALLDGHARIRTLQRELTAGHIDHFLSLVAVMENRDLQQAAERLSLSPLSQVRARLHELAPLRQRLKTRGAELARGQELLPIALASGDGKKLGEALALADPVGSTRCPLDWGTCSLPLTEWVQRLWHVEDPLPVLDELLGSGALARAGLWLGPAVLHLRDPQRYCLFNESVRQGLACLDDGLDPGDPITERYRLVNEAAIQLREEHALHPLEVADLLQFLAEPEVTSVPPREMSIPSSGFAGFCQDTFDFLAELARENRRDWMEQQRQRYHFAVRAPLIELCQALTHRYVDPVLQRIHGWPMETTALPGRALTRISRNVFGRSVPYTSQLWITFCPPGQGRAAAQLFVRLSPEGLRFGLRLGRSAGPARQQLRQGVQEQGQQLFEQLQARGILSRCCFGLADDTCPRPVTNVSELQHWARGRTLEVCCQLAPEDPLLRSEELPGAIALVFDGLLPLYTLCRSEPARLLTDPVRACVATKGFGPEEFQRSTYLGPDWLHRVCELLALKKQLILQGVPGTGKTHVARCLARLLTGDEAEAIRLVQFHPAYSYEEFVEGIRVRTVDIEGRHEVTYPVEDGLLCAFAKLAAGKPRQPHVLVIDEINRGNLPRIFGELLYLLEYRGQSVELPCSRRSFQLPDNLYLIGTMNPTDRSIAPVDQALRRRFSFLTIEPDPAVLAAWLMEQRLPTNFASRVLGIFDRLNNRLRSEVGTHAQIGHSYFMVPNLDESRLRMVWRHHVEPLLDDVFAGQPGRAAALSTILESPTSRRTPRPQSTRSQQP